LKSFKVVVLDQQSAGRLSRKEVLAQKATAKANDPRRQVEISAVFVRRPTNLIQSRVIAKTATNPLPLPDDSCFQTPDFAANVRMARLRVAV
jgi:hypothetical protein